MEPYWFTTPNFLEMVLAKWPLHILHDKILDFWKLQQSKLHKHMKGWVVNMKGDLRRRKEAISRELENFDSQGDLGALNEGDWQRRYQIEVELSKIYGEKEEYWQRRGGDQWLLKGDNNTSFFHSVANGRSRCRGYNPSSTHCWYNRCGQAGGPHDVC
jgi:hypothetical protein